MLTVQNQKWKQEVAFRAFHHNIIQLGAVIRLLEAKKQTKKKKQLFSEKVLVHNWQIFTYNEENKMVKLLMINHFMKEQKDAK